MIIEFQSLIGRLRTRQHLQIYRSVHEFQSLIGRLRTGRYALTRYGADCRRFQSLIGRLRTACCFAPRAVRVVFQSLIGRLRTKKTDEKKTSRSRFQSLIGRLRTYCQGTTMAWGTLPPSGDIIAHPIGVCQGVSSVPPNLTRCSRVKLKCCFRFGQDLSSKWTFLGCRRS